MSGPNAGKRSLRVLVAPDSFKGSAPGVEAAAAIAAGWRRERPGDVVVELPVADGGEGTLETLLRGTTATLRSAAVDVAGQRHAAPWALLDEGREAYVELASCCGLPLVGTVNPLGAGTGPVGSVLAAALEAGAERVTLAVGGSASTDGGLDCMRALGLAVTDAQGRPVPTGGRGLLAATAVSTAALRPPPPGGMRVLCDVRSPLFGPTGAAHVFAPQKGADEKQVRTLDRALRRWHEISGGDAGAAGAGAAGGIAYGLATYWSAALVPGARAVAELLGLDRQLAAADLVLTGEGCFDGQSGSGKAPGLVLERARALGVPAAVVAGTVAAAPGVPACALSDLAPSIRDAIERATHWLTEAGARLARAVASSGSVDVETLPRHHIPRSSV